MQVKMMQTWLLVSLLLSLSWAQRSEPMFRAMTKMMLPPDYENNPTQLNYGLAVTDVDGDGDLEVLVAGYNGPNLVLKYDNSRKVLYNIAVDNKSSPFYALRDRQGKAMGVAACDIDGDGREEIYFLNTNNAFSGAAVTDFDGDGKLDLIVAHGESVAQPLSIYKVNQGTANNWLRVIPRTRFGSFARGAKVVVYTKKSGPHTRIIDGGSGYLCEMEPVAHFGLGKDSVTTVEVRWPDGSSVARPLVASEMNSVLEIPYPQTESKEQPAEIECGQGFSADEKGLCTDKDECNEFPSVCSGDRPVCINTFGGYKCRPNKRCGHGFEPNEDGTACVAQIAYFGGNRSSSSRPSAGLPQTSTSVLLGSVSVVSSVSTQRAPSPASATLGNGTPALGSVLNLVLSCFSMRILESPPAPRYPYPWGRSSSHRPLLLEVELELELEPLLPRSSKMEISI
ncbi:Cartilage acidic protein 1 [Acipenser ruthenus]|uniref:Cartilage acidic protein 1 n=1 Tax=Acipenser ruthenus TaxID=7906 RepID=A0A444UP31_ACIRT|nr:Cartilage acidic protein 1 [Acipenser ruthenus]